MHRCTSGLFHLFFFLQHHPRAFSSSSLFNWFCLFIFILWLKLWLIFWCKVISLNLFKSFLMVIIIFIRLRTSIIFCTIKNFGNMLMMIFMYLKKPRMRTTRPFMFDLRIRKEWISKLSYVLPISLSHLLICNLVILILQKRFGISWQNDMFPLILLVNINLWVICYVWDSN